MIEVKLATLFVIALVAAVGAYFGAYLREKGKNLATREDMELKRDFPSPQVTSDFVPRGKMRL